jgi:intracellular multiplication protein IcmB
MSQFISSLVQAISSGLVRRHVADYIMPEISHTDNVIDLIDGSQMTVFKIYGMQVINGEKEFQNGIDALDKYLKTTVNRPGFYFVPVMERDADYTPREIDSVLRPMENTAKNLGMDISDILEDRRKMLLQKTVYESCYFTVVTTPAALGESSKDAYKDRAKNNMQYAKTLQGEYGPNYYVHIDEIDNYHTNHCESLADALKQAFISFDILDVEKSCSALGFQLERGTRSPSWRARVGKVPTINDKRKSYPMVGSMKNMSDQSFLIQQPLSDALTANDHVTVDENGVKLPDGIHRQGNMYYCTLVVKFWPDTLTSFQDIFRIIGRELPYRVAYYVDSNKEMTLSINTAVRAVIAGWANRRNAIAKDQVEIMRNNKALNKPYLRFRGQVTTWGKSRKEIERNIQSLMTSLSKWGSCESLVYSPNPIEAFVSSCAGATYHCPAPSHYAPTDDIARLIPFTRPASIWNRGSAQFSTVDGQLWTYNVASDEMENNNVLTAAAPGSGKSVTLNYFDFSMVFQEGMTRLPRMLTVDSAPSSKGKIEMLQSRLPPHMKDQVAYYRPTNNKNAAKINTLSLQLGLKAPLPEHAEFLEAFISQISISVSETRMPPNVPEIIRDAIKRTYLTLSNTQDLSGDSAKLYRPGLFPDVDAVLGVVVPSDMRDYLTLTSGKTKITWYEVRDILFKANHIALAKKAQRAAAPIMSDIIRTLLQDQTLSTQWTQEQLKAIAANITAAISDMPMINGMSDIEFDSVRILSFDCGDFAAASGDRGARQSALIYSLALFTGTQSYFYEPESIGNFDEMYHQYVEKLISECKEDYKRVNVDEFWRVKSMYGVLQIILMLFRVSRKFKISNHLASQNLSDYHEDLINSASGFIFLGKPKEAEIENIRKKVGLPDSAVNLLKSNGFGTKKGEMLFIFDTDRGRFFQHLFLHMGKTELWANSSTNRDTTLRRLLAAEFGEQMAYRILVETFPNGNCEDAVKQINRERGDSVDNEEYQEQESSVVELAKMVIKKYRSSKFELEMEQLMNGS